MTKKFFILLLTSLVILCSSVQAYNFTMIISSNESLTENFVNTDVSYGVVLGAVPHRYWIDGFNKTPNDLSVAGQLRDTSENNLSVCFFVSNYCKFESPVEIPANTTRYLLADGNGTLVDRYRYNAGPAIHFPMMQSFMNYSSSRTPSSFPLGDMFTIQFVNVSNSNPFIKTTLVSPINQSFIINPTFQFDSSVDSPNLNITNATLNIWFSNGSLFNSTTNSVLSGEQNTSSWNVSNFLLDEYHWNVEFCNSLNRCDIEDSNFTFTWGFLVRNSFFTNEVVEISNQTFQINISLAPDITVLNSRISYNGTNESLVTAINTDNDNWTITDYVIIPALAGSTSQNRSFFWSLLLSNEITGDSNVLNTNSTSQQTNPLSFGICNPDRTVPMINFTMVDEISGVEINGSINATTYQATFNIGATPGNLFKNLSVNNISTTNSRFDFCTNSESNIFYADLDSFYTASGYSDRNYFLDGAVLTNQTSLVNLFLLPDGESIQFFITVEQQSSPLENVNVQVAKFFTGEGVYKTIEIDQTDSDGKFTSFLELDKNYRFTVIQDGVILGIVDKVSICESAPCEMTIAVEETAEDLFPLLGDSVAEDVVYTLTFNQQTKIVDFVFTDTTGLATSFKMDVIKEQSNSSDIIIFSRRIFTSSGSMTFNATNLSDGDYRVDVYVARSPDQFIDFIKFVISQVAETLGLVGLFVAFILVVTIILGISFNPVLLVLAVPLSLTVVRMMGIAFVPSTTITVLYVLAGVIIALIRR